MADTATTAEYQLSTQEKLKNFVSQVLEKVGVAPEHARVVGDVLVAADMRGIESHGVARLESYYVSSIRSNKLKHGAAFGAVRNSNHYGIAGYMR